MKHILSFERYNGPNLAIDENPHGSEWYGGGITATPDPTTKPIVGDDNDKKKRGRRKMDYKNKKELSKQDRIEKMTDFSTTDDISTYCGGPKKPGKAGSPSPPLW
jgi:hypothetical protein